MAGPAFLSVHERAAVISAAAVLFVAVYVLRDMVGMPADGLTFLYVFPVVILTMEFGLVAGLAAALLAIALFELWAGSASVDVGVVGYMTRGAVFGGVAVLCNRMSLRIGRLTDQSDRYFELSADLLGTADRTGRLIRVNGRWERTLGWSPAEMTAAPITDFLHPADLDFARRDVGRLLGGEVSEIAHVTRLATKAGSWRSIEWSLQSDPESEVVWVAGRDVTEREAGDRARREAEERFRVSFENSALGMAVVSVDGPDSGRIVECNDGLSTLLGIPRDEIFGTRGICEFTFADDRPRVAAELARLDSGELVVLKTELRLHRAGEHVFWAHLTASIVNDADGRPQYRLSQLQDIDDRKRSEERLRHLANHDAMSGLYNRRRWVADLEQELALGGSRGSRGAILAIDLDHFKLVNDSAGHAVGDSVIAAVGRALTARLRSGDVAGRLGGDEFAVLLRRVDGEDAVLVAHGLFATLERELLEVAHPGAGGVTMSIGVALTGGAGAGDADELMASADLAMYEAKRQGGGRVELAIASARANRASLVPPAPSPVAVPHPR